MGPFAEPFHVQQRAPEKVTQAVLASFTLANPLGAQFLQAEYITLKEWLLAQNHATKGPFAEP